MNKIIEDYVLLEKIGQGQYGNVYKAENRKNKLTYAVKVILFADLNSPADRPEIYLELGDGTLDTVPRTSILDLPTGAGTCGPVRLSTYQTLHTYPGPGTYFIRFQDPNRTGGIINVPNSDNVAACVSAMLVIDPNLGPNQSIQFDSLQTLTYWDFNTLIHSPGTSEPDGDSLSFELIPPLGLDCTPIVGYSIPEANNYIWVDPATGTLLWDQPALLGAWVVAIRGSEWRNGQLIGQVTRDMTICVSELPTSIAEVAPTAPVSYATITDGTLRLSNRAITPILAEFVAMTGALQAHVQLQPGEHMLDISSWASGIYLVRTTASDGTTRLSGLVKR